MRHLVDDVTAHNAVGANGGCQALSAIHLPMFVVRGQNSNLNKCY